MAHVVHQNFSSKTVLMKPILAAYLLLCIKISCTCIWAATWQNQQNVCAPSIRPVWSESSLSVWGKLVSLATHWAHSESSDQTGRMPRLIWVIAGRTLVLLVLSCRGTNLFALLCTNFVFHENQIILCNFLFSDVHLYTAYQPCLLTCWTTQISRPPTFQAFPLVLWGDHRVLWKQWNRLWKRCTWSR